MIGLEAGSGVGVTDCVGCPAGPGPGGAREGRSDESGQVCQGPGRVGSNGHQQLAQLLLQRLHQLLTKDMRLVEEDSAHCVHIVAFPQYQL